MRVRLRLQAEARRHEGLELAVAALRRGVAGQRAQRREDEQNVGEHAVGGVARQ